MKFFASQVSLASGFHDTSFQKIAKCDTDFRCPCTPDWALRSHDHFIIKCDVDYFGANLLVFRV